MDGVQSGGRGGNLPARRAGGFRGRKAMTKFVVDLGNTQLTQDQKDRISGAIHAAVLPHIATLPNPGGGQLLALSLSSGVCVSNTIAELPAAHAALVKASGQ
jgi:hypothetical protein